MRLVLLLSLRLDHLEPSLCARRLGHSLHNICETRHALGGFSWRRSRCARSIGFAYGASKTTFSSPQSANSCYKPSSLAVGRFAGTANDVVVACNGGSVDNGRYYSLAGTANLALAPTKAFLAGAAINGLATTDLNADGYADVVGVSTASGLVASSFSMVLLLN